MKTKKEFIISAIVITAIIMAIFLIENSKVKIDNTSLKNQTEIRLKDGKYSKAPELIGIQEWINSEPLTIEGLKGSVVLVDFWTYTCINCIRTLPYLREWDQKYSDMGLVIIGVHTPEFEFEKEYGNLLNAVKKYNIQYPVVQDNNYATWNAYRNRFWPHKYLIDTDGFIRYEYIGEGGYEETERMIQRILMESNPVSNVSEIVMNKISNPEGAVNVDFSRVKTPEIYLGYDFSRGNFGNKEGITPKMIVDYQFPLSISSNNLYLSGKWKNNRDNMELVSDKGSILLMYQAKTLNIVANSESGSNAEIFLDDNYLDSTNKGIDTNIKDGKTLDGSSSLSYIHESRLYNLVSTENYGEHTIRMDIIGKGIMVYTFTFG